MDFNINKLKSRIYLKDFFFNILKSVNNEIILSHFQKLKDHEIFTKTDPDDLVTLYDKEAEKYIIKEIKNKFPNIIIIGEETSFSEKKLLENLDDKLYITIDPIDGTKNYIKKNDKFCSMISIIYKKRSIAGFIYYPLKRKYIYSFEKFGSQIYDFNKFRSKTLLLDNSFNFIGTGGTKGIPENKRKLILKMFNLNFKRKFIGSAGVETLLLALNKVDFIFHGRVTPWDHSPLDIIIREAGGKVLMFNNRSEYEINSSGPILATKNTNFWKLIKSKLI